MTNTDGELLFDYAYYAALAKIPYTLPSNLGSESLTKVQQTVSAAHLSKVATESSESSSKSDSIISFTSEAESQTSDKSNKSRKSPANGEKVTVQRSKIHDESIAVSNDDSSAQEKLTALSCKEEESLSTVQSDDLRSPSSVKSTSGQSEGGIKFKSKGSQRASKVAMKQPNQTELTSNKPFVPTTSATPLSTGLISKRSKKKVIPSIKSNEQNDYIGDQFENDDEVVHYVDGSPCEKSSPNKESKKKKKSQKHTTKRVLTETASNFEEKAESSDSFNATPVKQEDIEVESIISDVSKDKEAPLKTVKSEHTADHDSAYMECESEINDSCNESSLVSVPVSVKSSGCSSSSSIDEPRIAPKLAEEKKESTLTEIEQKQVKPSVSEVPETPVQKTPTPTAVKTVRRPSKKSTVKAVTPTTTDSKETKTTGKKAKAKTSSGTPSSKEEKKNRSKSFKRRESNYPCKEKATASQVVSTKVVDVQEFVQPKESTIEKKRASISVIHEKEVKEIPDIPTAKYVSKEEVTCESPPSRDVRSIVSEKVETTSKRPAVEMPPGFAAEIHDIQFGFTEQESSAAFFRDPAIVSCAASTGTVTAEAAVAERSEAVQSGGTILGEDADFNYEETVAMLRARWEDLMDKIKQNVEGITFYTPRVSKGS